MAKGAPPVEDAETRMSRFGRISAELLHDLSGMLATLSGRIALAREAADQGRVPSDELPRIQKDAEDLQRMITEILQELREDPRSPEVTFPLRESIESTIDRWVHTAPSVSTVLRGSIATSAQVSGPRSFMVRSLWNLLRNAGRHANSKIRMTLEPSPASDSAILHVEDDGAGVDAELIDQLFHPFSTGRGRGMGLGLSFSRWALERLGGTLEHLGRSSELGGAHFRMTVPLVQTREHPPVRRDWPACEGASPGRPRPLAGLRLALVDDEPALLSVLARVLRRAGAEVEEIEADTESSAEGVADRVRLLGVDVLLLDLNLGAYSGSDVIAQLGVHSPELPARTLLLTGGQVPHPAPDQPVLHKLVEWEELYTRIRSLAD